MADGGLVLQIIFIFIFFGVSFGWGLLPFKWKLLREDKKYGVIANCFAGGIFLSISMTHMLPDSNRAFTGECDDHKCPYDWAFFIAVIGYAMILFIERVIVNPYRFYGHAHGSRGQSLENQEFPVVPPLEPNPRENLNPEGVSSDDELNKAPVRDMEGNEIKTPNNRQANDNDVRQFTHREPNREASKSDTSSYGLLAALSVHSVFEGIAIGLTDGIGHIVNIIFAILIHKMVASVALGVALGKMTEMSNKTFYLLLSIFSGSTPLGIILGLAIHSEANPIATGTFLALSVGTFLYISASEVIVDEFADPKTRYRKFFAFMLGILVISLLNLWDND